MPKDTVLEFDFWICKAEEAISEQEFLEEEKSLKLYLLQELSADERDKICPEATTNLFNRITFGWISPLMIKGFK